MGWVLVGSLVIFASVWLVSGLDIGSDHFVPSLCTTFTHLNHECRYLNLVMFVGMLVLSLVLTMAYLHKISKPITIAFGIAWILFCIELLRLRPLRNVLGDSFGLLHTMISCVIYICIIGAVALLTSPVIALIIISCQSILEIVRLTDNGLHSRLIGPSQHFYLLLFIVALVFKIEQGGFKRRIRLDKGWFLRNLINSRLAPRR